MRPDRPRLTTKASPGAFLTLLAIVLAAPSAGRADCRHPGDRPAFGLGFDDPKADSSPGDLGTTPPPRPCDGPQCSGRSAPPMTPAPPAPTRAESWGLAFRPPPAAPAESRLRVPEDTLGRPTHRAISIFHPPRLPR